MAITREALETRLADLQRQFQTVQAAVDEAVNLRANINGAIQDCEFWLARLAAEPQAPSSPADTPADGGAPAAKSGKPAKLKAVK